MTEVLQTARLPVERQPRDLLEEDVPVLDEMQDAESWLDLHGAEVRCLVTHAMRGASRELIEKLPNLALITNYGAGLDLLDLEHVRAKGISIAASGDILTDDVADLAIWLVLTLLRGNGDADAFVRAGNWRKGPFPLGRGASGRRLGILGFGRIGQAIAQRGRAIGMSTAYHSRRGTIAARALYLPTPHALAAWSDLLVLALPANDATKRIIDAHILEAIGPQGALVNIARGSIVDQEALVSALNDGRLGGAALDVFDDEPRIDERLLTAPRLLLSPHLGSATSDSRLRMLDHVVKTIRQWRSDKAVSGLLP
ncbi:hydroxyacid dehydrogenase [Sphingobium sp. SCG-1]|uniref:2-hydroxyacid dehydrogenase n=1 Tax=Sphingobium sp. SCG-1 TaxID=2072936 RepID=UPI000CD6C1E2|nr:2-hydroxyacid dehydrogenase [Sphingobium sp. SCG-1]AUW58792.1 hydroxyacid dehydrogenase [Sphingobium sp. SCG-1]